MKKVLIVAFILAVVALASLAVFAAVPSLTVPGVNAKDDLPKGCVDCHVKSGNSDMTILAGMKKLITAGEHPKAADAMIDELKMMNIGTSVHFIPLHLHPLYQKTLATKMGDMPVSERVYSQEISLPLYPRMSDEDVHDVAWAIKKIILERRS